MMEKAQLEECMTWSKEKKKGDKSARSSFHTSNEVTRRRNLGGQQPIAINASDKLNRWKK